VPRSFAIESVRRLFTRQRRTGTRGFLGVGYSGVNFLTFGAQSGPLPVSTSGRGGRLQGNKRGSVARIGGEDRWRGSVTRIGGEDRWRGPVGRIGGEDRWRGPVGRFGWRIGERRSTTSTETTQVKSSQVNCCRDFRRRQRQRFSESTCVCVGPTLVSLYRVFIFV
jgi:hypothetical protein